MITLEDLYSEIRDSLDELVAEQAQVRGDAVWAEGVKLGGLLRAGAVGALLVELDTERYQQLLAQSAKTRLYVLKHAESRPEHYIRLTRAEGFFDGLAVRRFDLAAAIETRSAEAWIEGYEYEDDYAYVKTLHLLARPERSREEYRAATEQIARIEALLDGEAWARLEVCRALLSADTEAFDEAFVVLLEEYDQEIQRLRNGLGRDDVAFAAGQHVFIEGLALLSLASALGLTTRDEYAYCPREAVALTQSPVSV